MSNKYEEGLFGNIFSKQQKHPLHSHPEYGPAFANLVKQFGDEKAAEAEFKRMMATQFGQYQLKRMASNMEPTGTDDSVYKQGWKATNLGGQQIFGNKPGSELQ